MKTRKRRQDPDAEYNFWQPATDMMSALVYVLLLIIALLGLYLLSDYTGLEEPSSSSEEAASSGWHDDDYDGWHDGGADDDPGDGDGDGRYDQQIIQTGGGGGGGYDEDGVKAAVFAELIDEETERRIQEAGVRFELYRTDTAHLINGSLQTLNTTTRKRSATGSMRPPGKAPSICRKRSGRAATTSVSSVSRKDTMRQRTPTTMWTACTTGRSPTSCRSGWLPAKTSSGCR